MSEQSREGPSLTGGIPRSDHSVKGDISLLEEAMKKVNQMV